MECSRKVFRSFSLTGRRFIFAVAVISEMAPGRMLKTGFSPKSRANRLLFAFMAKAHRLRLRAMAL